MNIITSRHMAKKSPRARTGLDAAPVPINPRPPPVVRVPSCTASPFANPDLTGLHRRCDSTHNQSSRNRTPHFSGLATESGFVSELVGLTYRICSNRLRQIGRQRLTPDARLAPHQPPTCFGATGGPGANHIFAAETPYQSSAQRSAESNRPDRLPARSQRGDHKGYYVAALQLLRNTHR